MKQTTKGVLSSVCVVVALTAVPGCSFFEANRPNLTDEDALDVARQVDGTVFYVGTTFAGLPLTYAEKSPDESVLDASFGYGDCEPPENDGGCPLPLEIQNAICRDGHTKVGIFGIRKLRQRAARALRPVGGGDAAAPEVVFDTGPICQP